MSTVRRTAVLLAAASALAALTACGPTGDDAAGGSTPPPASPTKAAPAAPSAAPTKAATPAKPKPKPKPTSSTDPDYDVFPCSTADVKFTATVADPASSSYLLKVTNKGTKPCKALGHPVVTFGDLDGHATERGKAPAIEDAIRLAPGETAYAGLMGGPDDGKGKTVNGISLTMSTESDLEQTPLKASTPGLYVSPDKNSVTAWMNNAEDALSL